jgi:hypothetical protein
MDNLIFKNIEQVYLPHEMFWRQAHFRKNFLTSIQKKYGEGEPILPNHVLVVSQEAPNWDLIFLYNPPFRERLRECGVKSRFTGKSNNGILLGIKNAKDTNNIEERLIQASLGFFRLIIFTEGKMGESTMEICKQLYLELN